MVPPSGWLLVDKPCGVTSSRAVGAVRRFFKTKRVGYCGTLDPFASGLMLVCVGRATRLLPYTENWSKTYQFTLCWGTQTDTGDPTGEVTEKSDVRPLKADVLAALPGFTGAITQVPPVFSALKVKGRRACDLVRAGHEVVLKERAQVIESLSLLSHGAETSVFKVTCNRGTYVRTLAEDLARALGTVGHLTALRRIGFGPFDVSSACPLDLLSEDGHNDGEGSLSLRDPRSLLDDIPAVAVSVTQALRLVQGAPVPVKTDFAGHVFGACCGQTVALCVVQDGFLMAKVVLNDDVFGITSGDNNANKE